MNINTIHLVCKRCNSGVTVLSYVKGMTCPVCDDGELVKEGDLFLDNLKQKALRSEKLFQLFMIFTCPRLEAYEQLEPGDFGVN